MNEPNTYQPSFAHEGELNLKGLGLIRAVYFIGIGGIGMSAIARYFHSQGVRVSGYDKTRTDLVAELEAEGMAVHFEEDLQQIDKEADIVIYTPAVPKEHAELVYYQQHQYPVLKRSDVLQAITADRFNICIAGTHGKTTMSTMTAHILRDSGYGCTAFLGGLSVNYGTNYWNTNDQVCVVEADEYDRSFHKLSPDMAVISAMDADHLDIYGTEEKMQDAFVEFGNLIKEDGVLVSKFGLKRVRDIRLKNKISYSVQNDAADAFASDIRMEEGGYLFNVHVRGTVYSNIRLRIGGMHNVENTVAAVSLAHELKIDAEKIRKAVDSFRGVKRRFEYVIPPVHRQQGAYVQPVLVDDYAHHPEELRALLSSVRALFPQRIITVVFQPHLYTRTRDLAKGFADALSIASRVILLPIYPARELPIEGVSSEMILKQVSAEEKMIWNKDELLQWMRQHKAVLDKEFGEVVVMAGAGDIDALVQPVKEILEA